MTRSLGHRGDPFPRAVLTALLLTLAGLLALPLVALAGRAFAAPLVHGGTLLASLVFAVTGLAALLDGGAPATSLPLATPMGPMLVALDG
ncbi:MAG: hypothetical protein O9325_09000, partial [Roseomonas sp.]|nr:hypothetical protein [Roseomonas sp.]